MATQPEQLRALDPLGTTSPTNSSWNHFGRMGLVTSANVDENHPNASYPYAFSLTLAYADNLAAALKPGAQRLHFPVNPEQLALPLQRNVSPIDTLSSAQVLQVGNLQLRQLTWSSFFPMVYEEDYCVPIPTSLSTTEARLDRSPREAVQFIEDSMQRSEPIYLHFYAGAAPAGATVDLPPSLPCVVTGFAPRYVAGHPLDIFFDIELTEYRVPSFGTRFDAKQAPTFTNKRGKNGKVTTVAGDTLLKIATVVYGATYKQVGAAQILADSNKALKKGQIVDIHNKRARYGSILKKGQTLVVTELRPLYINRVR